MNSDIIWILLFFLAVFTIKFLIGLICDKIAKNGTN
jgi:hypothetical protein